MKPAWARLQLPICCTIQPSNVRLSTKPSEKNVRKSLRLEPTLLNTSGVSAAFSLPIRETRYPAFPSIDVCEDTFECLFDIQTRAGGARQGYFGKLLFHIAGDHIRPIDTVLDRVIRWFISQTGLWKDTNK
jgi:hypothetical protein